MLIFLPRETPKCRTWDVYRKYVCLSRSLSNCLAIIVFKEKNYKISCIMYFWCLNGFYAVVVPKAFGKKYLVLCLSKGYRLLIYIVPRKSPGFNQYDYCLYHGYVCLSTKITPSFLTVRSGMNTLEFSLNCCSCSSVMWC